MGPVHRRLSAIMVTDVVGFSGQMEADESATLAALAELRARVLEPRLAAHHGRLVKVMGDGVLVEFASVVDAVACAAAIQGDLAGTPIEAAAGNWIVLRIGVHLGDVVIEGDDLMGDGVNVAARLEQLCPRGGVLVSGEVHDQLGGKLDVALDFAGERQLKSIRRPVRVYALRLTGVARLKPGPRLGRRFVALAAAAVCVIIVATGLLAWQGFFIPSASGGTPTLAVLPFENAGGDPAQDWFAEGITDEILIALARSPLLSVVGRNSSSAYKDPGADQQAIAGQLGARYLVTGRVQRSADRVRVTARLTDARTGTDLWSEKYDRPLTDVFAVQDEIVGVIAARLDARIQSVETAAGRSATEVGAYEKVLQARALRHSDASKEATLRTRALLQEALALDPNSALAHAELGFTYYREIARRWNQARKNEALATGIAAASRALELDPSLAFANVTMGNLLLRRHDFAQAESFMRRAIELNPNDPDSYAGLANVLLFVNRAKEALPMIEKAIALDPLYPPLYDNYLGRALMFTRQFEKAIPVLQECVRRLPDSWSCHSYLATVQHFTGDDAAAASAFARMLELAPYKTVAEYLALSDNQPGPESDLLVEAFTALGLPPG